MRKHFELVWQNYFKAHASWLPLVSTVLAASELASPELEAMIEGYLGASLS